MLEAFLKYASIPSFILASANTYYNFVYKNKSEAGQLRLQLAEARSDRDRVTEELVRHKDRIINYQSETIQNQEYLQTKVRDIWNKIYEKNQVYNTKTDKANEVIQNVIDSSKTEELSDENIEIIRKSIDELKESGDDLTNTINEANETIPKIIDEITKSSNGGGSSSISNFISDYSWRIDELIPEIDLTDVTQSVAVVNFLGGLIILLCLFTIISAFYGNKLIVYFDLENKFPSLAKFIRLRMKFQNYTILFNFFLLTVVLINQIIINIIVLFNSF